MSFPQYQPHSLNPDDLCDISKRLGIGYTIHADEMLNPFDFNPKVSACYFDVMRDTIRFAKKIGATVINMHLLKGVYVTLPDKVILLSDVYFENYREKVEQFVGMCEEEIGSAPIKIAIENVDTNSFTESQKRVMDKLLSSPVFGLTLDTGHELCLDFVDTPVFLQYPDSLVHMHLHDAKGRSAHLPLGTAEVDVIGRLSKLPDDRTCLIEVKTIAGLRESVEYLKNQNIMK